MSGAELPMIPLAIPVIGEEERSNLNVCIDEQMVSTVGPFVTEFERSIARICGTADSLAVAAGTMGLHVSLIAMGVRPGDLVILPSFTFIASANAVSHAGAMPWLMDVDAKSWCLDPDVVRAELERCAVRRGGIWVHAPTGRRIAAIMPVYTLGTPADMNALNAVALDYGLPVVADAAAALGAHYRGEPIAAHADVSVFSFNGNKTITSGGGGGIVARDKEVLDLLRHKTTTARSSRDYDHDMVGFNYRMTNLEAAIGCAQAGKLSDFVEAKAHIRQVYNEAFAGLESCHPFPDPDWGQSAYWFSGVVIDKDASFTAREMVDTLNAEHRVGARVFWKPVHLQPPYINAPCSDMERTEDLWTRIVTLPCSTNITEAELERVIGGVRAIVSRAG